MVISLNSMAMTLAERNPNRAKTVLCESIELASTPGQEVATGFLMAALVATRLGDVGSRASTCSSEHAAVARSAGIYGGRPQSGRMRAGAR